MASASCTSIKYNYYYGNSGWQLDSYSSTLYGGYIGYAPARYSNAVVALSFKTPDVGDKCIGNSISFTIPFVKTNDSTSPGSGDIYIKMFSSDPTADGVTSNQPWPGDGYNHGCHSYTWSTDKDSSTGIAYAKFTISASTFGKTISPNKTYYITLSLDNNNGCVQLGYNSTAGKKYTIKYNYTEITDGSGSVSITSTDGSNKYKISCSVTEGTSNGLSAATVYWTTNGEDPTQTGERESEILSAGSWSKTLDVPVATSSTIKAHLVCIFEYNNATYNATKTVKYYGEGTAPATPTIKNNKNNTYTISGNVGKTGTNNNISTAKLNYTIAGVAQTAKTLTTTSGGTYTYTFNTPTNAVSTKVTAQVVRTMSWSGATVKDSASKTATIPYYAPITANPAVSIKDNGDNTFTITGTDATGGNTNNTLTTTYSWSYDSASYNQSGTGTKTLAITTPTNATRAVYAKANASLSVFGDPVEVKALTNPVNIKQYVAPGNPGTPVLSYSKSRLTIKEPWVFTWTAASPTNDSSSVAGYRLTLFKNGTAKANSIEIKNSAGTVISRSVDGVYIYDTTSLSFTVDPVQNGFAPGDTVVLAVRPYTKTATGVCLYNANNTYSDAATVQNAGVVHVKQNSQWHEGQVWVKVAGTWKEAETVNVKVSGAWKESQ